MYTPPSGFGQIIHLFIAVGSRVIRLVTGS